MSLINRMLRDLSSRQPGPGNVMDGIEVAQEAPARGGIAGRLALLAVLVAGFTALLYLMFGPPLGGVKMPTPRGLAAGAPTPAPEATSASRLQMDTDLAQSSAVPAPDASAAVPAPSAPPATAVPAPAPTTAAAEPAPPAPVRAPKRATSPTVTKKAAAAPAVSGEELYARARRALERGDDAKAEAGLIEALEAKPDLHYAREDLGNLRVRQGRFADAEGALREGLERDASFVGYRRLAARLELARDRPAAAVEVLLRDPPPLERDIDYHALMASAYQRMGRHEEASRGYRELARAQPDEANWWAGYGLSRDALDDAAAALSAYARARQLGGLDPRVLEHINLRTAALQAGDE
jgi:tetratricopeptide (TPR) repeat protein